VRRREDGVESEGSYEKEVMIIMIPCIYRCIGRDLSPLWHTVG
jgi:hypothetical protein